ncbi:MAG: hypothetical protein A3B68_07810 [Candidatus Melainabacteria bacterium RIFCSPHIGHO2_02_FULL_34_12]|nr:MAG: hypothetical protein A3B68_07810 [Candidatus Melainabacteria bacterium RIFCSPHIGHO2_02_FULL_34_12]
MSRLIRDLKSFVGYLIDIFLIATFKFSNPHSYTKFLTIYRTKKKTNSDIFIETGTFLGVMADRCSRIFNKVYTIELDPTLAQNAKNYLATRKNVTVIEGDGLKILKEIFKSEQITNAIIFLDGHYSGGITACGDIPEPAVEEISVLSQYKDKIGAIIIDDFRVFGSENNIPTKSELFKSVENKFGYNEFEINVYLDQLLVIRKVSAK